MGDKISGYPVKTVIHDDDLLDISNTEDSGVSYDASQKTKVSEFMAYVNSNVNNIYGSDGDINVNRTLTSNGSWTKWLGGDVIVTMDNESDDYAFIIQGVGSVEFGRFGFDQLNASGELSLSNLSGEFFKANDGKVVLSGKIETSEQANLGVMGRIGHNLQNYGIIFNSGSANLILNAPIGETVDIRNNNNVKYTFGSDGMIKGNSEIGMKIGAYQDQYGLGMQNGNLQFIMPSGSIKYSWNIGDSVTNTEIMTLLENGNLGIGTTTPDSASILDLSSTTRGFLGPRMTTIQRDAISSPPFGLFICNATTSKLNFYNGSAWEVVTSI